MSEAMIELFFWVVVFIVFFFGFKKLQNRSKARQAATAADKAKKEQAARDDADSGAG